jgi:hypothetical protein
MATAMTRQRLYSPAHDVCIDIEPGAGGTLVVEIRADVAVGRIVFPRRDPKALLRFSNHLYIHDNVLHDLIAHHLGQGRRKR